ncbi:MAG TPA: hypothetical protein PLT92_13525 [Ignavibacteriaceae bacterium]|nr:hypothetical protein [Ignavibacteriaceae bacterium]
MAEQKKYLRITFSNGACNDIPLDTIKELYAKIVVQQIENKALDLAILEAEKHFQDNDDALIEFASFGLSWIDVVLDAITVVKAPFVNKEKEWTTAKKEIIEK